MSQTIAAHTVSPATGLVLEMKDEDVVLSHDNTVPHVALNKRGILCTKGDLPDNPAMHEAHPDGAIPTDIESNEELNAAGIAKKKKSVEWSDEVIYKSIFGNAPSDDEDSDASSTSEIGRRHSSTHGSSRNDDDISKSQRSHSLDDLDAIETAVQQANYLRRKKIFILSAAGLLAFNNGFLNGATLSGLASPGSDFPALTVTGLTASYTMAGLSLSQGLWEAYGVHIGIILSYFSGCFIAGFITPDAKPYRLEPSYGPTFILGGIFLLIGGITAIFESYGVIAYWFSAAASGIQNGIASRYSANLIRCTVTGTSTDIALVLAELVRGKKKNLDNGVILTIITANFWVGGVVSYFAAKRFLRYTLLANAVMFWVIGFGIIFFLVTELGLSVNAAVSGNWKWRKTMQSLRQASASKDVSLLGMFDVIDKNNDGEVSPDELLDALLKAGVKTNLRTVKVLVNYADVDNSGTIDRKEWEAIVERLLDGDFGSCRSADESIVEHA
eukprot:scaffold23499_cov109-Cylindrotheca_fusiformis.AAC.4